MNKGRRVEQTLAKVLGGNESVLFREFEALLIALGFEYKRQTDSHRIYLHPRVARPFPIQPDGNIAKRYQIRQLRDMVLKFGLAIDERA